MQPTAGQLQHLQRLAAMVLDYTPEIEHTGCDVEGHGPEIIIDRTVAIWPTVTRVPPVVGERLVPAWAVALIVPDPPSRHEPPGESYTQQETHRSWLGAAGAAVHLLALARLSAAIDSLAHSTDGEC